MSFRITSRILALATVSFALAACGAEPLTFTSQPVKIGYDAWDVRDVALVDVDLDGDTDLVTLHTEGFRYLKHENGTWSDATPGTGLDTIAVADRMVQDGEDMIAWRVDATERLAHNGIGVWLSEPSDGGSVPAPQRSARADIDGDGVDDLVRIDGTRLAVLLTTTDGSSVDVTRQTGADAIVLDGPRPQVFAGDFDADGDVDILGVGTRIAVLWNNGGSFDTAAVTRDAALSVDANDAPWFSDDTDAAGLRWTHTEGDEQWDISPTMGPGAAWADVDDDGDEDLFVVGGTGQSSALFLNDGTGHFTDATAAWRLDVDTGAGMGATFADFDNDGDPDIYVTHDGPNVLWRHDGDHFTDVSASAGVDHDRWGAGVAWADIDGDADLDLFVTNYLEFDLDLIPPEHAQAMQRREDPIAMLPYVFPGQANVLYRNDGDGTFTDITQQAGLVAPDGKSLAATFFDQDGDGLLDLYVANDTTPNTFWRNLGDGTFEEVSLFVGLDDPRGGMGIALDDMDHDGDLDVFTTYWQLEPNGLYRNNAIHPGTERRIVPRFEDVAVKTGLAKESVGVVGWGIAWTDLDNDGDRDMYVANGYTSPDYETTMICVGQPDQLFENVTDPTSDFAAWHDVPRFELVESSRGGPALDLEYPSRGVAAADADGDGDVDLVITANNERLVFLRNQRGGRSLRVVVTGDGEAVARDALGTRVTLTFASGEVRHAWVRSDGNYLSGHEGGVRFGLGTGVPSRLMIHWPDGELTTRDVSVNESVIRITR